MNLFRRKINLSLSIACLILANSLQADIARLAPDEETKVQQQFTKMYEEPGQVIFTPPEGWQMADPKALPKSVKLMVVGKGEREFPPSINLASEKFNGTLKQYLKTVKAINDSQGTDWKDLGTIKTEAGDASLSQVDAKTQWGETRTMHVILLRDGTVYIMSAAALKDEFSKYYKDFFNAMRSLRVNKDLYESVSDTTRRKRLLQAVDQLKQNFAAAYAKGAEANGQISKQSIFESSSFQKETWTPFKDLIVRDFSDMTPGWQNQILDKAQHELVQ